MQNERAAAKKSSRAGLIAAACILSLLLIILIFLTVYLTDSYTATPEAQTAFKSSAVTESTDADGNLIFAPTGKADAGFIFYPGGKVDYAAYAPLMRACAQNGILCVLTPMPFNLAIFDTGAAEGIADAFPEVEGWYIGGHSLGGSMAAEYAAKNSDEFDGLILLASYSAADISSLSLDVISIYGSEDRILNLEKYNESKQNLPYGFEEHIIEGGSHAYFGMYGEQDGDGVARITPDEQICKTADIIEVFVNGTYSIY